MTKKDIDAAAERWLPNGKWVAIIIAVCAFTWSVSSYVSSQERKDIRDKAEIEQKIILIQKDVSIIRKDVDKIMKFIEKAYGFAPINNPKDEI